MFYEMLIFSLFAQGRPYFREFIFYYELSSHENLQLIL